MKVQYLGLAALMALAALPLNVEAKSLAKDPVVMTIAGKPVLRSEFEYFYNKNNQQDAVENKTFDEYVDLFINYKLKVAEAYSQGVDTTSSYINELAGYRKQLAEPYLQIEGWGDSLLNQYHDRRQYEVHAQHLLLTCDQKTPQATVDSLYQDILKLQQEAEKEGADFTALARQYSMEPAAKQSGGDLGYFGPLQMVYPFEQAAFNTPVGQTTVVRSNFGWHLVKVIDKRPTQGEVMVAHIMKNIPRGAAAEGAADPKQQIDSIYQCILAGEKFEDICAKTSDDKYTAPNGGAYPWLGTNARFPKEWLDVAYSLKEKGEISAPFATQFGWHIMKLVDKRSMAPRDDKSDAKLKEQLERDPERKNAGMAKFVEICRQELAQDKKLKKTAANWSDEEVLAWADSQLESKYADFKNLYREYHDGLMLFEVSSKAVWDKAAQDTVGLQKYFDEHRADYKFETLRFKGAFIECVDDDVLHNALKDIYNHNDAMAAADIVRKTILQDTILTPNPKAPRFHIVNGLFKPGDNAAVDVRMKVAGAKFTPKDKMPRYMTYGRILSKPESLDDVRGLVVADYQNVLEKAWVEDLRQKFEVKVNQKELDKLR